MKNTNSLSRNIAYAKQVDFIGQDILLEEARVPKVMKSLISFSVLILLTFLTWGATTTIDQKINSVGIVEKTLETKSITHFRGGTIDSINIKNGEFVNTGDILVSLQGEDLYDRKDQLLTKVFYLSVERDQLFAKGYKDNKDRIIELENAVDIIDANIRNIENEIEALNIRAPFSGIVSNINIEKAGDYLGLGQELMELTPINAQVRASLRIPSSELKNISIGTTVTIYIESNSIYTTDKVSGVIESIASSSFYTDEGMKAYEVTVAIEQNIIETDTPQRLILPGMRVSAEITTARSSLLTYLMKPIMLSSHKKMTEG